MIAVVAALGGGARELAITAATAWADVAAPGPATPEAVVSLGAATAALVLVAWTALALLVSAAEALLGTRRAGRPASAVRALARVTAPVLMRSAVAAVLGATLAGTVAPAATAAGAPVLATAGATAGADSGPVSAAPGDLSPSWAPPSREGPAQAGEALSPAWRPTAPPPAGRRRSSADALTVTQGRLRAAADVDDEVVVRRGDTLWSIAARHLGPAATAAEVAAEWPGWFTANREVIGPDPDRLRPGQRLRAPQGAR